MGLLKKVAGRKITRYGWYIGASDSDTVSTEAWGVGLQQWVSGHEGNSEDTAKWRRVPQLGRQRIHTMNSLFFPVISCWDCQLAYPTKSQGQETLNVVHGGEPPGQGQGNGGVGLKRQTEDIWQDHLQGHSLPYD